MHLHIEKNICNIYVNIMYFDALLFLRFASDILSTEPRQQFWVSIKLVIKLLIDSASKFRDCIHFLHHS